MRIYIIEQNISVSEKLNYMKILAYLLCTTLNSNNFTWFNEYRPCPVSQRCGTMKIPIILKTVFTEHRCTFCSPSPQTEVSIWAEYFREGRITPHVLVYEIGDDYIQQIQWVQCGIRSIFSQHTFPYLKFKSISSSLEHAGVGIWNKHSPLTPYYRIYDLLMKDLIVLIQDHYEINIKVANSNKITMRTRSPFPGLLFSN